MEPNFNEGDEVFLRATVHHSNHEQALVEFESAEGSYSIRVPLGEIAKRRDFIEREVVQAIFDSVWRATQPLLQSTRTTLRGLGLLGRDS